MSFRVEADALRFEDREHHRETQQYHGSGGEKRDEPDVLQRLFA